MVKPMPTTQFSMRIESETKARLEAYSSAVKRSQSQIAAKALDEYLERHQAQLLAIEEAKHAVVDGKVIPQAKVENWLDAWSNGDTPEKPTSAS